MVNTAALANARLRGALGPKGKRVVNAGGRELVIGHDSAGIKSLRLLTLNSAKLNYFFRVDGTSTAGGRVLWVRYWEF